MNYNDIYAVYPSYNDGVGNGIMVFSKSGKKWYRICFATFKHRWAEAYGMTRQQAFKQSEKVNGKKKIHVVQLGDTCTLTPFKVRIPRIKDDGAYGYIVDEAIEKVEKFGSGTKITLINGEWIISKNKIGTINAYRRRANNLRMYNRVRKEENGKIEKIVYFK